jgi:hypothetical protein
MFKKGDKFVHFTKYGGVNIGLVHHYGEILCYDLDNLVVYKSFQIVTTQGVTLQLDGTDGQVYLIDHELVAEDVEKYKQLAKTIKN